MRLASTMGSTASTILHDVELTIEERERLYGRAVVAVAPDVIAGSYVTVLADFTIGASGVRAGGHLGLGWLWPLDWGHPQTTSPAGEGYVSVAATVADSDVVLTPRYVLMGGVEPWNHQLLLDVRVGRLAAGDRVRITIGDRSHNGKGWSAPTCRLGHCGFAAIIDPSGHGPWHLLPESAGCRIVPGTPYRLVAVAPSNGVAGKPITATIRVEDCWGNPTPVRGALETFSVTGGAGISGFAPGPVRAVDDQPGVYRVDVRWARSGIRTLQVANGEGWTAETNPIRIAATESDHGHRVVWGDLHSGQASVGVGCGTIDEHFRHGRDVAALEFLTYQANDHHITSGDWRVVRETTERYHEDGRFVTMLGCEWSPETTVGGDRNVVYRHDEPALRRSGRFFVDAEPDGTPDLPTAREFHDAHRNTQVLVNLHVGGRPTNLDYYEPRIERLAEIHSTHATSEWFIMDALSRGYRVGITAGTDGIRPRPGAEHPGAYRFQRNCTNGLTAVIAPALTRDAVWEALSERRCYATTGQRILLWVDVNGHPMGSEIRTRGTPRIHIECTGTDAIERLDLLRGTTTIGSWSPAPARSGAAAGTHLLRVLWGGAAARGTARAQRVDWDGTLTVAGGHVRSAEPVNFLPPLDTLTVESDAVAWRSATAGYDAGVVCEIDGDSSSVLRFETAPASFECRLGHVSASALRVDAGGLDRFVTVGPAPDPAGSRTIRLTYDDFDAPAGVSAYWVRVTQVNRARAWSSPVYVLQEMDSGEEPDNGEHA